MDALPLGGPTPPPTMTYWRGLLFTGLRRRLFLGTSHRRSSEKFARMSVCVYHAPMPLARP